MEWAEEPLMISLRKEILEHGLSGGLEDERLFELATKHLETHQHSGNEARSRSCGWGSPEGLSALDATV